MNPTKALHQETAFYGRRKPGTQLDQWIKILKHIESAALDFKRAYHLRLQAHNNGQHPDYDDTEQLQLALEKLRKADELTAAAFPKYFTPTSTSSPERSPTTPNDTSQANAEPSPKATTTTVPKHIAAQFREIGNTILRDYNHNRKWRIAQDAGAKIATALRQAYKMGISAAINGPPEPPPEVSGVAWLAIPSRARTALSNFIPFSQREARHGMMPSWEILPHYHSIDAFISGKGVIVQYANHRYAPPKILAWSTISTLEGHGLLEGFVDEDGSGVRLNDLGWKTWLKRPADL